MGMHAVDAPCTMARRMCVPQLSGCPGCSAHRSVGVREVQHSASFVSIRSSRLRSRRRSLPSANSDPPPAHFLTRGSLCAASSSSYSWHSMTSDLAQPMMGTDLCGCLWSLQPRSGDMRVLFCAAGDVPSLELFAPRRRRRSRPARRLSPLSDVVLSLSLSLSLLSLPSLRLQAARARFASAAWRISSVRWIILPAYTDVMLTTCRFRLLNLARACQLPLLGRCARMRWRSRRRRAHGGAGGWGGAEGEYVHRAGVAPPLADLWRAIFGSAHALHQPVSDRHRPQLTERMAIARSLPRAVLVGAQAHEGGGEGACHSSESRCILQARPKSMRMARARTWPSRAPCPRLVEVRITFRDLGRMPSTSGRYSHRANQGLPGCRSLTSLHFTSYRPRPQLSLTGLGGSVSVHTVSRSQSAGTKGLCKIGMPRRL